MPLRSRKISQLDEIDYLTGYLTRFFVTTAPLLFALQPSFGAPITPGSNQSTEYTETQKQILIQVADLPLLQGPPKGSNTDLVKEIEFLNQQITDLNSSLGRSISQLRLIGDSIVADLNQPQSGVTASNLSDHAQWLSRGVEAMIETRIKLERETLNLSRATQLQTNLQTLPTLKVDTVRMGELLVSFLRTLPPSALSILFEEDSFFGRNDYVDQYDFWSFHLGRNPNIFYDTQRKLQEIMSKQSPPMNTPSLDDPLYHLFSWKSRMASMALGYFGLPVAEALKTAFLDSLDSKDLSKEDREKRLDAFVSLILWRTEDRFLINPSRKISTDKNLPDDPVAITRDANLLKGFFGLFAMSTVRGLKIKPDKDLWSNYAIRLLRSLSKPTKTQRRSQTLGPVTEEWDLTPEQSPARRFLLRSPNQLEGILGQFIENTPVQENLGRVLAPILLSNESSLEKQSRAGLDRSSSSKSGVSEGRRLAQPLCWSL